MRRLRYRLVLLDLDGTLVDTREDLGASANRVRGSFGLGPLPLEAIVRFVGHGTRALAERAIGPERRELHDEAERRLLADYREHCLDRSRPEPGLVEVLDALAADGAELAVLTNKPEALARKVLGGLGLVGRLVGLVGGDTLRRPKPAPDGVEHLRHARGADARETLLVGDSRLDVETARAAGVDCCGVLWGFDPDGLRAAAPRFLISRPEELARVVRCGEGAGP